MEISNKEIGKYLQQYPKMEISIIQWENQEICFTIFYIFRNIHIYPEMNYIYGNIF